MEGEVEGEVVTKADDPVTRSLIRLTVQSLRPLTHFIWKSLFTHRLPTKVVLDQLRALQHPSAMLSILLSC